MNQPAQREFHLTDQEFHYLAALVSGKTGIMLSEKKRDMVYSRLARRLRALGIHSFRDYCGLLESEDGAAEMGDLVNALTTNLTHFFREAHHFEHLGENVVKPFAQAAKRGGRLRIWSAGCSSGMEPYSIAMTLLRYLPNPGAYDARILATDIDTSMLARGREGEYPLEEYANIPATYRGSSIAQNKNARTMQMGTVLKETIAFRYLNLLETWPFKGPFDAIFCRNVVIYFDKATQKKLFERFAKVLNPEGFLYIGHSENLFNVTDQFRLIGQTVYRRGDVC